jgi:hypothetical protein
MADIADSVVGVDELLRTLSDACIRSAHLIEITSARSANSGGVKYVVPQMRISVKLSLSTSGGTVKGVLFTKKSEGFAAESLSQIDIDIAAVPQGR